MWPKLKKQINLERELLARLLTTHQPLIIKAEAEVPDPIEISALAAMLHGYYGGIENIFKRILIESEQGLPQGPAWHKELLAVMSRPGPRRPPVITQDLAERLREYLEFRHFFRSAYTFQILWDRMAHLVRDCREVFEELETELDSFMAALDKLPSDE